MHKRAQPHAHTHTKYLQCHRKVKKGLTSLSIGQKHLPSGKESYNLKVAILSLQRADSSKAGITAILPCFVACEGVLPFFKSRRE